MTRLATVWTALAACSVLVTACSETTGPGTAARPALSDSLSGLIVSQPIGGRGVAGAGTSGLRSSPPAGSSLVYVSLVPGSVAAGLAATVRDQESGLSVTAPIVNGGFDPVAIAASVGDTLLVDVTRSGSVAPVRAVELVRAKHPPVLVRTTPPTGGRDVPLNVRIIVVFSDPIDPATLSTGSLQLWRDTTPVAGTVQLDDSLGLKAEFLPDSGLAAEASYRLVATTAIADLAGTTLESDVAADFSTGQVGILVDASRDGGVWWFPQAGPFDPSSDHQGKALADYLRLKGYRVDELGRPYAITPELLQAYAIVIRAGEFGAYTAEEMSAYRQFVAAGGRLLLLADHMRFAPPDALGQSFGLVFAGITRGPNLLQFGAGHPLTNGVTSLTYGVGSALLSVPDSAVILGSLDSASYVDLNDNSQQDANEPSAPPVFGAMPYGAGRIVFCGDVNLWEWSTSWALVDNVLAWFGVGSQPSAGTTVSGSGAVRAAMARRR